MPRRLARWVAAGLGAAAGGYAILVALAWVRYGDPPSASADERDHLLDRFMPEYDIAERHHVRVHAPAAMTLDAATRVDLQRPLLVRAIFSARALLLGAESAIVARPEGLLEELTALGWRVLAEVPGREVVVGAVTQPWLADVVFRGLAPEAFAAFQEPGFVKIAWTLRADPMGPDQTIFRTETRVAATDDEARRRFRWYWSRFSPGIVLIRRLLLGSIKDDAERAASAAR